jgi:hypothetical protein
MDVDANMGSMCEDARREIWRRSPFMAARVCRDAYDECADAYRTAQVAFHTWRALGSLMVLRPASDRFDRIFKYFVVPRRDVDPDFWRSRVPCMVFRTGWTVAVRLRRQKRE